MSKKETKEPDKIQETKEKYEKLKSEGKLNVRSVKRDIMNSPLMSAIRDVWDVYVKDLKTITPIDISEVSQSAGINLDFNHLKDKFRRGCEIYALSLMYPEEFSKIKGFYGIDTTEVLRKHFGPKNFKIESNTESKVAFLSIDLTK